jgi:hypothetical protein
VAHLARLYALDSLISQLFDSARAEKSPRLMRSVVSDTGDEDVPTLDRLYAAMPDNAAEL